MSNAFGLNIKDRKKYFKSERDARLFQKEHKKSYGYRPALFTRMDGKKVVSRFIIVPKGLQKLNGKRRKSK